MTGRDEKFRIFIARLRAKESLNAAEVKICADFFMKLWTGQRKMFNDRISRARKALDAAILPEDMESSATDAGSVAGAVSSSATDTGSVAEASEAATEKGEKEKSPQTPLKEKTPKENPLARVREENRGLDAAEQEFGPLFDGFWSAYPAECPRRGRKADCRKKYFTFLAAAKRKARSEKKNAAGQMEAVTELHRTILKGIAGWRLSKEWFSDNGTYIKAPLAWLNQMCWEAIPKPYPPALEKEAESARSAKAAKPKVWLPKDWTLCRERCAMCGETGCRAGKSSPPDRNPVWQHAPEECDRFRALAHEGDAPCS